MCVYSWERLNVGGEGDDRGWDGWMASLTQWIWVWVNSRSWWWTGRPGVLQSLGVAKIWTWLSDWTDLNWYTYKYVYKETYTLVYDIYPYVYIYIHTHTLGFPRWHSGKVSPCQCRRHKRCRFNPWFRKMPWSRKSSSGKFHWQRSLVGYSPWGRIESNTTEHIHIHPHICGYICKYVCVYMYMRMAKI